MDWVVCPSGAGLTAPSQYDAGIESRLFLVPGYLVPCLIRDYSYRSADPAVSPRV